MDIMTPHPKQMCRGIYYATYPRTPNVAGQNFEYEYVDVTSWRYRTILTNVTANEATSAAIKTKIDFKWSVGGFIRTQDGRFYTIISVAQDYNAAPKQAFRMFGNPAGVEFVLRLAEKEEPWGVQ